MSIKFTNEEDLGLYFMETGEVWLSLVSADGWPYIVTSGEYGDIFVQGFANEDEEPKDGTEWLRNKPERWYPVTLVAPLPEGVSS